MNEQQRIGFDNLLAQAQQMADQVDQMVPPIMAGERLRRALATALAGREGGRLSAVADWAAEVSDDGACPNKAAVRGLRDDALALQRWIEGRL